MLLEITLNTGSARVGRRAGILSCRRLAVYPGLSNDRSRVSYRMHGMLTHFYGASVHSN